MKKANIVWALTAVLLVAMVSATLPSGSLLPPDIDVLPSSNSPNDFEIILITPENEAVLNAGLINFRAEVNEEADCALILDDMSRLFFEIGTQFTFTQYIEELGQHNWKVTCNRRGNFIGDSELRTFTVQEQQPFAITSLAPDAVSLPAGIVEFTAAVNEEPDSCSLFLDDVEYPVSIGATTISSSRDLPAGEYDWTFSCIFDGTPILSETANFIVEEAAAINIVSLFPANGFSQGQGPLTFSVETNIQPASCTLVLDGVSHAMTISSTGATKNIVFGPSDVGEYVWSVSCMAGLDTATSNARSFTITQDSATVFLSLSKEEFFQGETVTLTGTDFSPFVSQNINVHLEYEGILVHTEAVSSSSQGTISYSYDVPYDAEIGFYLFFVINEENTTQNATIDFDIVEREVRITLNDNIFLPDEEITVRGYDFIPDEPVDFSVDLLSDSGTQTVSTRTLDVDGDGEFTYDYSRTQLGEYRVTVTHEETGLSDSATFEVVELAQLPMKTYYRDADNDGFGTIFTTQEAQSVPEGYVSNSEDCDDISANARPGGKEVCDGLDNNCDGFVDNGNLCPLGQECIVGICSVQQTTTTPTTTPVVDSFPTTEAPAPVTVETVPDFSALEEKSSQTSGAILWWILIPILVLILLFGGFLGFVAYEGYLDFSSWTGFTEGIKKSLGMEPPKQAIKMEHVPIGDFNVLSHFITKKRGEGYDDLTIRNALLRKGWKEPEVDQVFDDLYQ